MGVRTDGPQGEIEKAYKAMTAEQLDVSVEELEKTPRQDHPRNTRRFLFYAGWKAARRDAEEELGG